MYVGVYRRASSAVRMPLLVRHRPHSVRVRAKNYRGLREEAQWGRAFACAVRHATKLGALLRALRAWQLRLPGLRHGTAASQALDPQSRSAIRVHIASSRRCPPRRANPDRECGRRFRPGSIPSWRDHRRGRSDQEKSASSPPTPLQSRAVSVDVGDDCVAHLLPDNSIAGARYL